MRVSRLSLSRLRLITEMPKSRLIPILVALILGATGLSGVVPVDLVVDEVETVLTHLRKHDESSGKSRQITAEERTIQ